MKDKRLQNLSRLADMIRDRELAKVEKVVSHMNRLQGDIARMRTATESRHADPALDAARLSGAEIAWMGWTEAQLRRNQAQMAALRITHESALRDARKAFGRSDVLSRLSRPGKPGG